MTARRFLFMLVAAACGGDPAGSETGSTGPASTGAATTGEPGTTALPTTADPTTAADPTTTTTDPTTGGDAVAGLELLPRLAGLWSGPASMTPLGTFARMNMDVRAASGRVLFCRADLDADNNLRFAFEIEAPGGAPTLVYRNGGDFLGLLRDSRTALVEHGADAWRFCATPQGCDYIDARFEFTGADTLVLDVQVKGAQHVYWEATREEPRTLPTPFPASEDPLPGDAPFPDMPALVVDVGWQDPLAQDGEVWVILSTTDCDFQLSCTHSRSLRTAAAAGATSATLTFEQIHAGGYKLNAVLDRNGNLAETLFPDAGDGLGGVNQEVVVSPTGTSAAKTSIVFDL
jgi:hypothetical protein